MLEEAVALYDAQAGTSDPNLLVDQIVPLLEKSLFVAAHFDSADHIHLLVTRFRALLQAQQDAPEFHTLDAVAHQCFRGLRKLGMRDEVNQLLQQTADAILRGQDLHDAEALGRTRGSALPPCCTSRRAGSISVKNGRPSRYCSRAVVAAPQRTSGQRAVGLGLRLYCRGGSGAAGNGSEKDTRSL